MSLLREALATSPMLVIPLGSLFLFLGVFLGVIVRAFGRRASAFDDVAALPLFEDSSPMPVEKTEKEVAS